MAEIINTKLHSENQTSPCTNVSAKRRTPAISNALLCAVHFVRLFLYFATVFGFFKLVFN